jgi:hypothetical protein
MAFSYNDVWEDTVRLIRANAPLLIAIAGVFIFLPALILAVMLPAPEPQTQNAERAMRIFIDYARGAWPWFLLVGLFNIVGSAAMMRLVFARETTVGAALVFGLTLLPFWLLVQIICGFIFGFGLLLLIVPGLYLIGRLVPATAVLVAEPGRNPFAVIGRSFALTRGHGWAICGLVFVIAIVGSIVTGTTETLLGLIFLRTLGHDVAQVLSAIVTSALSAAFATLFIMLYAAIYRALTANDRVSEAFE